MKKFIIMAARNIFRNKLRLIITVISILFGVMACTMLQGFIHSIQIEIKNQVTRIQTGDMQLSRRGYSDSNDIFRLDKTIKENGPEILVLKESPEIEAYTPRLKFSGMISNGANNTTFISIASDPKSEFSVCPKIDENLIKGRFLSANDINEIVISKFLAESMALKLHDPVVLLLKTRDGVLNTVNARIGGIFAPMLMAEKQMIYTNINMARDLLDLGKESTEYAIRLKENINLSQAKISLLKKFKRSKCDIDLLTWEQVMAFFKDTISIQDLFNNVISFLLFIIVTTTIVNTILMTVYDRIKEIGTIKALGMKSRQVISLFIIEGSFYGILGGMIGLLISQVIVTLINANGGVVFSFPTQIGAPKPWIIFPRVSIIYRVFILFFAVISGAAASFYPALKASKMKIVDILQERILYR